MGRAVLAAAALLGQVASVIAADPWLPTQWSGRVRTTAHLIDPVRMMGAARARCAASPSSFPTQQHI